MINTVLSTACQLSLVDYNDTRYFFWSPALHADTTTASHVFLQDVNETGVQVTSTANVFIATALCLGLVLVPAVSKVTRREEPRSAEETEDDRVALDVVGALGSGVNDGGDESRAVGVGELSGRSSGTSIVRLHIVGQPGENGGNRLEECCTTSAGPPSRHIASNRG